MRGPTLSIALLGACFGALLWAAPVAAHSGDVRRTLALEPAGETLHVLLHLEITGQKRRAALAVLADQNRDGRLSDAERSALEERLAVRALDGIRLYVGTSTAVLDGARTALMVEGGLPTSLMLHGETPLPKSVDRIGVRTVSDGADPLTLMVRPGSRPVLRASRKKPQSGALTVPMGPIDRVFVWIAPSS